MIKKIMGLLMIGALVFVGCGKKPESQEAAKPEAATVKTESKKIKIGVSFSNFNDTFLMTIKDGMEKYSKETGKDLDVTYVDAKEDLAVQMGQVENFATQKMDAIIVVPVNTEATTPMSELAISKKIPLIYANRKPQDLAQGTYFVGSNDKSAGVLQGEYLAKKLNRKGNIVILQGILSNEGAISRTQGVQEVIDKHPDMKITKVQAGNWERAKGMSIMENWLSSGDKIDAVASNNDDMAIGAIEAIKSAKKDGQIVIIGVDATPDGLGELKAGNLSATVFQDGLGQGKGAIDKAIKLSSGEQVEQVTMIPFQLVTPENLKDFLK